MLNIVEEIESKKVVLAMPQEAIVEEREDNANRIQDVALRAIRFFLLTNNIPLSLNGQNIIKDLD